MANFAWSDKLTVKVRLLDEDHKRLLGFVSTLKELAHKGAGVREILGEVDHLLAFARTHLTHEETLMRRTAYPSFIPHKIEHDRLFREVEDFRKRLAGGQVMLNDDSLMAVYAGICDHIVAMDAPLGAWLSKHAKETVT
ncbi:MAG: hemerythrin domain-containing protein [Alphaproteobacteria bacterium]|nr:hemerythrin domain-containing protein [Alphaproteobacteria bacterium]